MNAVDVVIPTRNRQANLTRCLWALEAQTVRDFRVVVVDDGSDVPVTIPRLSVEATLIHNATAAGPAAARNGGLAHCNAPLIAFIDDDVCADPCWLEVLLRRVDREPPSTVVFGPLLAPRDWRPTPWNRWEAETLHAEYERMLRGEYEPTFRQFFTGNAVVPRAAIEAVGGFDERFFRAEDVELAVRLARNGCRFVFEPDAIGWHYARRSLAGWRQIPRQYARYDVMIDRMHGNGWLEMLHGELEQRHLVGRLAQRLAVRKGVASAVAASAIGAAIALAHGPTTPLAMRALSLAYQLEYTAALAVERSRDIARGALPSTSL